jgi:predicted nucleic acid-binding protein
LRRVFADTLYWIAIFLPNDPWSQTAKSVDLEYARLVTTEEVLSEFLTGVAAFGDRTRRLACELVRTILDSDEIGVIPQSHESFQGGLELYQRRPDKKYSLTDCITMNVMRREGITQILTNDHHFAQEGFQRLMPRKETAKEE